MRDAFTLQLAKRGQLTLPKGLRDTYNLNPDDTFTLLDLGGVFVLSPRSSEVDRLAGKISQELIEQGESLESMLSTLREAREQYGNSA